MGETLTRTAKAACPTSPVEGEVEGLGVLVESPSRTTCDLLREGEVETPLKNE